MFMMFTLKTIAFMAVNLDLCHKAHSHWVTIYFQELEFSFTRSKMLLLCISDVIIIIVLIITIHNN